METSTAEIDVSRDGKMIAVADADSITIFDRTGKLLHNLGSGLVPKWSHEGSLLAFVSRRSGESHIWLWNATTKQTSQLTKQAGGINPDRGTRIAGPSNEAFRFDWSSDDKKIAFASRERSSQDQSTVLARSGKGHSVSDSEPLVLTQDTPDQWALTEIFRYGSAPESEASQRQGHGKIHLLDVESGNIYPIQDSTRESAFSAVWAPNSTRIAFTTIAEQSLDFGVAASDVRTFDTVTGERRILATGVGIRSHIRWSRDGRKIAFLVSERVFGRPRICVLAYPSGELIGQIDTFDRYISDFNWTHDGSSFIVTYKDGPSAPIGIISAAGERVRELGPKGDMPYAVFAFSQARSGDVFWYQQDPKNIASIQRVRIDGQFRSPITVTFLRPESKALELGTASRISWRNSRGEVLTGTVLLPSSYDRRTKYPLIVDAYPMRNGSEWTRAIGGNYVWASHGYVVFRPSVRSPNAWVNRWTTESWSRSAQGSVGWDIATDDIVSGVKELVNRGYVDQNRVCLYGFSNGGGVVNHVVTQTGLFKCAVSVAPALSNWVRRALWEDSENLTQYAAGKKIDTDLAEYIALSPVFRAGNVATPMLLAVGDQDNINVVLDSIEMYNGLRRNNREVVLVRYPGQKHVLTGDALRDFWNREMQFFQKYLQSEGNLHSQLVTNP